MSDYIDRQQAIGMVDDVPFIKEHPNIGLLWKAWLEDLPSAQRTGEWIEDAKAYYTAVNEKGGGVNEDTPYFIDDIACSECLALFSVIDNEAERFDFCPNCGADMRGAQDG